MSQFHSTNNSAQAKFDIDPEYYERQTGNKASDVVSDKKYKIKLYTVLPAYKPHQKTLKPLDSVNEQEPGWKLLEVVVKARYPDRKYADILRAIQEYKHFLELKQDTTTMNPKSFLRRLQLMRYGMRI